MTDMKRRKSGSQTDEGEPMKLTFKEAFIFWSVVAVCATFFTGVIIYAIVGLVYL